MTTKLNSPCDRPIVGRFAPSPTGELHLGSLTTAIASYCHIKSLNGSWLLRIEDTDFQRCQPRFSQQILLDLQCLGLHWDGEVVYQSQRTEIYNQHLLHHLYGRIYSCSCSRKQLQGYDVYPRFCLSKPKPYVRPLKSRPLQPRNASNPLDALKVRIQLPDHTIAFLDGLQGVQMTNPQQSLGDVVVRRANGIINYFLAVSVDDGLQGVTHVMRGLDIMPLTTAQIAIMYYLNLPAVEHWYHLPLVENQYGQKLSKQNLAQPIDTSSIKKCQQLIHQALALLKQPHVETDTPQAMISQAVAQWQNTPLKNQCALGQV